MDDNLPMTELHKKVAALTIRLDNFDLLKEVEDCCGCSPVLLANTLCCLDSYQQSIILGALAALVDCIPVSQDQLMEAYAQASKLVSMDDDDYDCSSNPMENSEYSDQGECGSKKKSGAVTLLSETCSSMNKMRKGKMRMGM